jgi:hypothetical protein
MNLARHPVSLFPTAAPTKSPTYRVFALFIVIAGLMSNAACTGLTGQLGSKGAGSGTQSAPPPVTPPAQPPPASGNSPTSQLSVSTAQVNFGSVTVGNSASQVVSLTNVGTADITISAVSASGAGFGFNGGSGVTLDPTQSVSIYVNFNPTGAGSATGTLSISSNSANPVITVGLSGSAVAAVVLHTVGLTWAPSTSPVIGYYVYRGPSSSSLAKLNSSAADPSASYSDQGVPGGQTYVYAVTSVDSSNVESGFSNEVSVTIPQ